VLILALDTTTRAGSVAVTRDDTVLALVDGDASRTHGERLPDELNVALSDAGVDLADLELLVVATGPGAFTGLRIGLAAIQGLAMVTNTPVVGVSALDALAESKPFDSASSVLVTWMDAQRGEVFSASYTAAEPPSDFGWRQREAPIVAAPAAILAEIDAPGPGEILFAGDGAVRYRSVIETWSQGRRRVAGPPGALAPALARIGRRLAARGAAGPPHALQPLYVRRPDAELDRLRRATS
jgi:tRNA threonylcarbamoyladenosine biosynthesis protein TsaB